MEYWKTDEELPGLRALDLLVLRHDSEASTLGVRGFPRKCVNTAVFSDVTTSNLVDTYRRFEGTCCLFNSLVGFNVARAKKSLEKILRNVHLSL